LSNHEIKYIEKDISYDVLQKREMIERSGGRSTTPQIFMGNRHIESFDVLHGSITADSKESTAA